MACGSGRQPNCGVEQRAPPMFSRAIITLGIDYGTLPLEHFDAVGWASGRASGL